MNCIILYEKKKEVSMKNKYLEISKKLKVLSDPKRLEIIDMLSCNEFCACEILEQFDIT